MDCPRCGTRNLDGSESCRMCGNPFTLDEGPKGPSRECPFCKTKNALDAPFCSGCNRPMAPMRSKVFTEEKKAKKEKFYDRTIEDYARSPMRTARLSLAGIIFFMIGFFVLVDVTFTLGLGWEVTQTEDYDRLLDENPALGSAIPNLVACQGIRIVFACLAILGGFAAIRRMQFGLAAAGGVFSIFALGTSVLVLLLGWWMMLSGVLFLGAILGLIFVIISKREFMLV